MAKTALEKLHVDKQPKIVDSLPEGVTWGPPGCSMVVSTPLEVDGLMKRVRTGKLTTITEIRESLAQRHGTDIACPISTGIFINISAAAAEERRAQGAKRITPWWRTLKSGGELNPKFPGGVDHQRSLLEAEGFTVQRKGKRKLVVADFEKQTIMPA